MQAVDRGAGLLGRGHSLQWMIIVFCAVVLSVMWFALMEDLAYERREAIERRHKENNNLARLFEEHVQRTLAAADITLRQVEAEYRARGRRFDLKAYFEARRDELAPYSAITVLDQQGTMVLGTTPGIEGRNYGTLENFQYHLHNPSLDIFIAKPRQGVVLQRSAVFLSRRMNGDGGSFAGTTSLTMDPGYFSSIYDDIDLGPDSVVVLIGTDGVVRARRSNVAGGENMPIGDLSDTILFRTLLPRSDHGQYVGDSSPVDRVSRLISYRKVRNQPLIVMVGTSMAATLQTFEPRGNLLRGIGAGMTAVIVAFAALILFQLSRDRRVVADLRESEQRYALVERASDDGIWDVDLLTGRTYVSPRGKAILGYREHESPEDDAGYFERVHPDDRDKVRAMEARSVREGTRFEQEYRVRHRDGSYRWLLVCGNGVRDAAGRTVRLVGTDTDITALRESQRQIQEQARLLDLIFRHSVDSIVLLDKDYNFLRVSESYEKSCQREASSFSGLNHFSLYPSSLEQELEPCRREKKIYSAYARPFVFPDHPERGTTYWDLGMVPILDPHGEIEFFIFTLKDVSDRVRAEKAIVDSMTRIRALSGRILAVQEEERRKISRELHDEVGQGLTAAKIRLQALTQSCSGRELSFMVEQLDEVTSAVAETLEQVRRLSLDLRPMLLDDLGLAVAMASLIERDAAAAGWTAHFEEDIGSARFDSMTELACYRVAQEALNNVMRHAAATEVWIELRRADSVLLLTVRDNGSGFDPASALSTRRHSHLGVLGMEERVRNLGGHFEIRALPAGGTLVRASLVIDSSVADSDTGA